MANENIKKIVTFPEDIIMKAEHRAKEFQMCSTLIQNAFLVGKARKSEFNTALVYGDVASNVFRAVQRALQLDGQYRGTEEDLAFLAAIALGPVPEKALEKLKEIGWKYYKESSDGLVLKEEE